MEMRPVGASSFRTDGQANELDEANGRFSKFCERAWTLTTF